MQWGTLLTSLKRHYWFVWFCHISGRFCSEHNSQLYFFLSIRAYAKQSVFIVLYTCMFDVIRHLVHSEVEIMVTMSQLHICSKNWHMLIARIDMTRISVSQSVSGTLDRPRVAPSKTCGHVRSSRRRWRWAQCGPRSAASTFGRVVLAGASTPAW